MISLTPFKYIPEKNEVDRLNSLLARNSKTLKFLAYEVTIAPPEIRDTLEDKDLLDKREVNVLWLLLSHLSKTKLQQITGKLISFRDLPGGHAYDNAFRRNAVMPVSETFGKDPRNLIKAGKLLGGCSKKFGDCSIEIPTLPKIALTYVLWGEDEFPAQANILFDESASDFLPTEDLAVLAEITTMRLKTANIVVKRKERIKLF